MGEQSACGVVSMEYAKEIRSLTYGDFKRLKYMVIEYIEQSGDEAVKGLISAARSSEGAGGDKAQGQEGEVVAAFLYVFKKVAMHLDVQVHAWFCDLLDVTPEEYDGLPIDMDIQVLNQLKGAPGVENFFTGVSLLFSGTAWFQRLSKTLKGKFGTLIDSLTET